MNYDQIKTACEKFGFSAIGTSERVTVTDKKGRIAAVVTTAGIDAKKLGMQQLCGSLLKNAIRAAM